MQSVYLNVSQFIQGIKARVYETFVVLILLGVLVFSLAWVIYGIFYKGKNDNSITVGKSLTVFYLQKNGLYWV